LIDFRRGRALQLEQRSRGAEEARQNLLAQLDQWEASHVVAAPHAGRVWFLPAAVERQHVGAEQAVMMVLPETWRATARIEVPLYRSGQIAPGHDVVVELSEYPKSEYGPLRGKVTRISPMARDERYIVDAELSMDRAKMPALKPGTTGLARIVTRDRSILSRLFDRLIASETHP
jgi:HlyD family secretion protein